MRALAVVPACALIAAGCGSTARVQPDATWQRNAAGLVAQLRGDVAAVQSVPPSQSPGTLYALLVAYSDMGGCSRMAAATGAPPQVIKVLSSPCGRLERASSLFTSAETDGDNAGLRHAAREAALAQPALVRAAVAYGRGEK